MRALTKKMKRAQTETKSVKHKLVLKEASIDSLVSECKNSDEANQALVTALESEHTDNARLKTKIKAIKVQVCVIVLE